MGDVIGAGELHKGVKLLIDGEPWEITEFDFSKPGKGQAIYNCKLRNITLLGFLGDSSGKEPICQCRRLKRCGFNPWVGKAYWRRAHGQRSLVGYSPRGHKELETTEATEHAGTERQQILSC